ncbi:5586_t:CDS:2 [Racocetra persica]|uniref:5586_t:CDS:1 n=1 Tax=Racocetra persica TaxID=160502 RepID=A0ACA9LVA2_9GLOM|nr:5586_t:CDS:2 [Racocetra persica]
MKKQVGGAIGKSVGHAFSTLPKTFFGGRGHYSEDKFVYQLRRSHKVYHRTVKDFFEGFKGELTFGFQREGSHTDFDLTRTEESGTLPVGREGGYTIGKPTISAPNAERKDFDGSFDYGGGYTGGGNGYLCQYREGASEKIKLNWSDYQAYKNKPYQKIAFGKPDEEYRFGTGSGTIVCRYMKGDSDEEEIYQADDPEHTTWILKKDLDRYSDGICLFKEVKGIKILTQKVEVDFNSLNLQFTVNIQGFSGIEAQVLSSGGMMLPDTNTLNTNQLQMPTQIQSMVNTEQIFVPLEMPQLTPLQNMMDMNQQYLQNNISQQENIHQNEYLKEIEKRKTVYQEKYYPASGRCFVYSFQETRYKDLFTPVATILAPKEIEETKNLQDKVKKLNAEINELKSKVDKDGKPFASLTNLRTELDELKKEIQLAGIKKESFEDLKKQNQDLLKKIHEAEAEPYILHAQPVKKISEIISKQLEVKQKELDNLKNKTLKETKQENKRVELINGYLRKKIKGEVLSEVEETVLDILENKSGGRELEINRIIGGKEVKVKLKLDS